VLLPLAAPGVIAGTVLAFARALGEFGATLMLAGNIPGRTQTMPIAIFSAVEGGDMRGALLWVILIVVISLAIIRLLNRSGEAQRSAQRRIPVARDGPRVYPQVAMSRPDDAAWLATLDLDIERRLDTFALQVAFCAGRGAVGLLGASGSGKSMTLRMIAGISTPDRGRIVLNGRVLFDRAAKVNTPAAKRRIGFVFQDYALFPHLTVAENVGFGLHALPEPQQRARIAKQLELLHISDLAHRYPKEISGGQRQRVAIARCMAIEPDALLLDEPFAALDPHLRRQMEEQLRATLADYNGVVVFVTHDMEEAFRFCTDLLVLDAGRIIAQGPKLELFERPQSVAAAQLTGCKNIVSARLGASGRIAVEAWNCELAAAGSVSSALTHVGFRSHQLLFQQAAEGVNTFPCWLVSSSEAPHEMTLYLRLHSSPQAGEPPQLQADMPKDAWRALSAQPQPWRVTLDPKRLLLLEG
jgi:molybdate transport system permease protein